MKTDGRWHTRRFAWALGPAVGVAVWLLPSPGHAQPANDDFGAQVGYLAEQSDTVGWGPFIKAVQKTWKNEQKFTNKARIGFSGNSGANHRVTNLDASYTLSRGTFPREFRLDAGFAVRQREGTQTENVTKVLVNYDYHPETWLETYGFTQRFTNEFLSIRERYEVGFGAKLEWELPEYTADGDRALPRKGVVSWANLKDESTTSLIEKRLADRWKGRAAGTATANFKERAVKEILPAIHKKYSKFQLGLAVSLLAELEQASIDTLPGPEVARVTLPTTDRWRASIRPSVVIHPDERGLFTFDAGVYLKYALDKPRREQGQLDYRADGWARFAMDLDGTEEDRASLSFVYELTFDNVPPRLDPGRVAEDTDIALGLKLEVGL